MPASGKITYSFAPGGFKRVNAKAVIKETAGQSFSGAHSDIRKPQVAELIVQAARAGA